MHDRRIDGVPHTFGNQGGLFLRAMVWWDHETESFWSQPTGQAIHGEYLGVRLEAIPAAIETWAAWLAEHPDTLLMGDPDDPVALGRVAQPFARPTSREVAGITLNGESKAYVVDAVRRQVVVNDEFAGVPLLVYANFDEGSVHIYVRLLVDGPLEFEWSDGQLRDTRTRSVWNGGLGLAVEGPLAGAALRVVPHSSAFDWAWARHHPRTTFWPSRQ